MVRADRLGSQHDLELDHPGVAQVVLDGLQVAAEDLPGAGGGRDPGPALVLTLEPVLHHGEEQLLLVAEVVQQPGVGDPGVFGDPEPAGPSRAPGLEMT